MPDEHKSYVCIGGPRDGAIVHVKNDGSFACAFLTQDQADTTAAYVRGTVKYVREKIHTINGDVSFWVPEGQNILETLDMLLRGYTGGNQ